MTGKPRILLVDDDREIALGLSIRLGAAGYEVKTAHDGRAGLDMAMAFRPDAMLLDIRMPIMDGLAVLAELRTHAETKEIPVIVLSANVAEKAKCQSLDLGARHFVGKPYVAAAIIKALRSILGDAPGENPCAHDMMDEDNASSP